MKGLGNYFGVETLTLFLRKIKLCLPASHWRLRNPSSWSNESEVNKRAWPSRNLGTMPFLKGGAGESTEDAKDNNRND